MGLAMAGIDYNKAEIDIRQRFAFTKLMLEDAYVKISSINEILGAVIISTCNRTEIYVSYRQGMEGNPFRLLCDMLDMDFNEYLGISFFKAQDDILHHLCQLSCGIKSQIFGEDQIISQVRQSIDMAREHGVTDSYLEVLFRNAITAAKEVKTSIKLSEKESSIVDKSLDIIRGYDYIKRAMVIGNGAIGRLMATKLIDDGYEVFITLRQYKNAENIVPTYAEAIDYKLRYEIMHNMDVVISATLSPHFTVTLCEIIKLQVCPKVFIDLAVPLDVDPQIERDGFAEVYNLDKICMGESYNNNDEKVNMANSIIQKYINNYKIWCFNKENI